MAKSDKKNYGFSSVSVKFLTVGRLRALRKALTLRDMKPPSMDEVVASACTALEESLKAKAAALRASNG